MTGTAAYAEPDAIPEEPPPKWLKILTAFELYDLTDANGPEIDWSKWNLLEDSEPTTEPYEKTWGAPNVRTLREGEFRVGLWGWRNPLSENPGNGEYRVVVLTKNCPIRFDPFNVRNQGSREDIERMIEDDVTHLESLGIKVEYDGYRGETSP